MSIIIKKIILTLFISSFYLSFAQVKKERNYITIYIDLKDKSLESYNINKDSSSAHLSIYIEKYESKKERDKAIQKYKNRIGDPDSVGLPSFSFTFYVFNRKPEKLKSLDGIKYITIKEFRENNYKTTSPTYIIHKLKDGTYLRWKTYTME